MGEKFFCDQCGHLRGCNPNPTGNYEDSKNCYACGNRGISVCESETKGFKQSYNGKCNECLNYNIFAVRKMRRLPIRSPRDPILWWLKVRMWLIEVWCYLQNHKNGFLP